MSVATIRVSPSHLHAIRESLEARRDDVRAADVDRLLAQIPAELEPDVEQYELTAARATLWTAVYESLCVAADRLAEDCHEYWRGAVDGAALRVRIGDVGERLDLLEDLGPPGR